MKNKKGFTLIEIIVTISLLALISTIVLLSISTAKQKHDTETWNKLTTRVKSAASAYMDDSEGLKALVYSGATVYIEVGDLINAGLLDENYITDPTDGISILDKTSVIYQNVKVFLNANDAIEYVYPAYSTSYVVISPTRVSGYTDTAIDYLNGVKVYNDNGIEVDNTILTTIQKTGGKLYSDSHTIIFTKAGEYTLTYTFNNINYTRTYYIETLPGTIINTEEPEDLINPDQVYSEPGIYSYVVPITGTYIIRTYGAQGGNSGGKGGYISGELSLTASTTLTITVGGMPTTSGTGGYNGGGVGSYGGGGSSTVKNGSTTLLLGAGGGGGLTGGAGGEGTSTGGAAVATDEDLETVALETPASGIAGTNGAGGGSGNKYSMCLEYEEVYDACATTTNTCSYGCDTCSRAIYQYCCRNVDNTPICFERYYTCSPFGNCTGCSIIRWETYSCNCSSCYYGSPTTCVGGYVKGDCTSLDAEATKPGQGGTSYGDNSVGSITKGSGIKTGNGLVEIKLIS